MTPTESRNLKIGSLVCWGGNAGDGGKVTETNWSGVTIAWDNHHVAVVHHGDMRDVQRAK
jgi:hypothetical protein